MFVAITHILTCIFIGAAKNVEKKEYPIPLLPMEKNALNLTAVALVNMKIKRVQVRPMSKSLTAKSIDKWNIGTFFLLIPSTFIIILKKI